jgi:hypothetical protein
MAFLERLQKIEKKYAIALLGFILAIIFGALTIYTTFYQKKTPAVKYEIESSASVFDVKEDVGKLDVIFNGVNLRETRQTLTLMTLKVSNIGSEPVRKADYDDKDPLGFDISTGEIIKAELLRANKQYLTKNFSVTIPSQTNATSALFSPVILEVGDAIWVKLLILHKEKTIPELKPIGTVAGAGDITLVGLSGREAEPSFLVQVTSGTIWVQLVRTCIYFFVFISAMFIVIVPIGLVLEFFDKQKRKRKAAKFRQTAKTKVRPEHEWVIKCYIDDGGYLIHKISILLAHPQRVYDYLDRKYVGFYVGQTPRHVRLHGIVSKLVEHKVVMRTDGQITIDESFREFLGDFSKFLGITYDEIEDTGKQPADRVLD